MLSVMQYLLCRDNVSKSTLVKFDDEKSTVVLQINEKKGGMPQRTIETEIGCEKCEELAVFFSFYAEKGKERRRNTTRREVQILNEV